MKVGQLIYQLTKMDRKLEVCVDILAEGICLPVINVTLTHALPDDGLRSFVCIEVEK